MIVGIGNDLVDIRRIEEMLERYESRFTNRLFTEEERKRSDKRPMRAASYAKRFAAKEAMAKALGTGIAHGISWQDMGVVNDENGRPVMVLTGGARKHLESITPANCHCVIHLSLTDEPPLAQAYVIIKSRPL